MKQLLQGSIGLAMLSLLACQPEQSEGDQKVQRGKELLQSDPERALAEFEAAQALNGKGAQLGMAAAKEKLGEYEEAEKILLGAQAADAANLDINLALVRIHLAQKRFDDARKALQSTLGHAPPHVPSLLLFAALANTEERAAAGRKALDALSGEKWQRFRESAEYAVAESTLLGQGGDAAGAQERLVRGSESRSISPQVAVALADALELVGRLRAAEWLLERAAADPAAPEVINEHLAKVAMDLGHLSVAKRAISKLRTGFKPDPRALLLAARLYELENDDEGSATASGRALDALPSSASAADRRRVQLAHIDALIRAGHGDKAESSLRKMLKDEPKFSPARVILGAVLLGADKAGEAIELLAPIADEPSLAAQAYPVLVAAYRQVGEMDKAVEAARKFARGKDAPPRAAIVLGEVLVAANRGAEALSTIEAALKERPKDSELIQSMIELTEKVRGQAAALELAKALVAASGERRHQLLLARLLTARDRKQEAISLLEKLASDAPTDTRVWAELAAVEAQLGHNDKAAAALQKVVDLVPYDTAALVALAGIKSKLGKTDEAIQAYEAALQVEPNSVVPLNNLASLLTGKEGQQARAVELARRAKAMAGEDPAVTDTLGWALVNAGNAKDIEEAVTLLRASSKELRLPEGYYHYGIALKEAGKTSEALVELRRAIHGPGTFKGLERAKQVEAELTASSPPSERLPSAASTPP